MNVPFYFLSDNTEFSLLNILLWLFIGKSGFWKQFFKPQRTMRVGGGPAGDVAQPGADDLWAVITVTFQDGFPGWKPNHELEFCSLETVTLKKHILFQL